MDVVKDDGARKNVLMGILAYVGILIIIPYISAKDDPFVKFHIKQGLVLFIIEMAIWILGMTFWSVWMLLNLANLVVLILAVIGIMNAAQGKEQKLPLVGNFSSHFNF